MKFSTTQIVTLGVLVIVACAIFGIAAGATFWIISLDGSTPVQAQAPTAEQVAEEQPAPTPTATKVKLELPTARPTAAPTTKPVPAQADQGDPIYIGDLSTQVENGNLEVFFSLFDKNQAFTSADGKANITIVNDGGQTVYSNSHQVSRNDFGNYTRRLTGQRLVACNLKLPLNQIQKSGDSHGKIYLEFVTSNGIYFEEIEDTVFNLPEFTEAEMATQSQQQFEMNATSVNRSKKIDNYIAVTIHKIGLMTLDNETYIRVDITVVNIGNEKIDYYYPDPVILGKSANQFEKAYVSKYEFPDVFETGEDIYPGVKKSGALFFEIDRNSQLDINELIIDTGLTSYSQRSRSIGDGQALLYDRDYVFSFDLSWVHLR